MLNGTGLSWGATESSTGLGFAQPALLMLRRRPLVSIVGLALGKRSPIIKICDLCAGERLRARFNNCYVRKSSGVGDPPQTSVRDDTQEHSLDRES